MACNIFKAGEVMIIACGPRGSSTHHCAYCSRPCTKRCDFKFLIDGGWRICDKPLCGQCVRHTAPDTDVCRIHPKIIAELEK